VDIHKGEKKSAAEVIMTQLHSGGKFDHDSYKVSGGLHGVGVSVVNALSQKLELNIERDGKKYFIEFKEGEAKAPLKVVGKSKNSGTKINFLPSIQIFSSIKFSFSIIQKRMRELAFLNKGIKIKAIGIKVLKFSSKIFGISLEIHLTSLFPGGYRWFFWISYCSRTFSLKFSCKFIKRISNIHKTNLAQIT
jgi:DNA gyrase/topoisomerase IV subunit B